LRLFAQGLSIFGGGFLSKFEGASCPNELLEAITLVDTPGVLSGEKQRIERTYDFIEVCRWFAARCDVILLLFDPYSAPLPPFFTSPPPTRITPFACQPSLTPKPPSHAPTFPELDISDEFRNVIATLKVSRAGLRLRDLSFTHIAIVIVVIMIIVMINL
jgi:hypothetical protein